jgi:hypothetical protein
MSGPSFDHVHGSTRESSCASIGQGVESLVEVIEGDWGIDDGSDIFTDWVRDFDSTGFP